MSIKIGSTDISAVCDKIYIGSDEVYSSAPSLYTTGLTYAVNCSFENKYEIYK